MTFDPGLAERSVGFQRHPAAIDRHSGRAPAFPLQREQHAFDDITTWHPSARFAQPGPPELSEVLLDTVVPLAPPPPLPGPPFEQPVARARPSIPAPLPVPPRPTPAPQAPRLPVAERVEPVRLPIPVPVSVRLPVPVPVPVPVLVGLAPAPPDPPTPPNPPAAPPPSAESTEPEAAQQGASRLEPETAAESETSAPTPQPERGDLLWPRHSAPARTNGASDGLWPEDFAPAKPRRRRLPGLPLPLLRQVAFGAGALAALLGVVFTTLRLLPPWLNGTNVEAVFNAPMMVVRAAVTGRVTSVAVNPGQMVEPSSPLLILHTDDQTDPDKRVLAGVHGVVRSVETVPGSELASGAPLVRLHDCDRAFLTIPPNAKLAVGDTVQVKLPNMAAVAGTVRPSVGIMEPPDSLVIGLTPDATAHACPVGATGTVSRTSVAS